MKIALLLLMLVTAALGKSIDNPAETPDRPSGMEKAVPTVVEGVKSASSSREGKSIAVPPPVQVTSGVVTVLGDARKGRVIEIGDDGIPIIHGVRSPGDPTDTRIYRNARIVNNKLITPEDEIRINGVKGRALSSNAQVVPTSRDRAARVLNKGSGSSPTQKVVSYSYLAAPQGGARVDTSSSSSSSSSTKNDVVYGTGSAAKPPGQVPSDNVAFESVKASSLLVTDSSAQNAVVQQLQQLPQQQQGFVPSNSIVSSDGSASISNPVPFGHSTAPSESFAVHQAPQHGVVHSQFHQQPATHPPRAPPTVFQSNPNHFVIQDTTFQAHPGAPTFTLPIPVPNQQAKSRRRNPHHRNQLQAASDLVEHAVPATGELSYTSYNPYDLHVDTASTKKPIYQKMLEPFMKAGEKIYQMASPVFDPMIEAGQKFTQRLKIPSRVSGDGSSPFSMQTMNDYISRTVDQDNLPLVAGVAALAAITLGAIAVAASSNITIGKRSVDDPTEEFMYQMLDPTTVGEPTLLNRLEQYTSWTDSKCSKRIFCDVMTQVDDDYLYTIEKRLGLFLRMLNRGSEEESALKRTADEVMQAVRRRECQAFSCGGTAVDSSKVSRLSTGPR